MPKETAELLPAGVGEYLEALVRLSERGGPVPVPSLAQELQVSAPSANEMVRRLREKGLAEYEPYQGVSLTDEGRRQGAGVLRRHRLWEVLLTTVLEMSWDEVHEEACRLEHATSPHLEAHMARMLEGTTTCPHGRPLPEADGTIREAEGVPLSSLDVGTAAVVLQVPGGDPELLRYLGGMDLHPGQTVTVAGVEPFEGPVTLVGANGTHAIGRSLADTIIVQVQG